MLAPAQEKARQREEASIEIPTKYLPFTPDETISYASNHCTPFHLYDEQLIRTACRRLKSAFSWAPGFKNYFAVKATPNPNILNILREEGFGCDCSSMAELLLAERVGFDGEEIYFTSNNTAIEEYVKATEMRAIINLDDISHIDFIRENIGQLPNYISFRYNPGYLRSGNKIIGNPANAKFGLTKLQILKAYQVVKNAPAGVKRFGLHTMIISNCLDENEHLETAKMLFELVGEIYETSGVRIEAVNFGGGIGIPYKPDDQPINLESMSDKIKNAYQQLIIAKGLGPLKIFYECGRYLTGPAGFLISRVRHQKQIYKSYLGVDASMVNLMRPSLYNAYHHITVIKDEKNRKSSNAIANATGIFDVVGSLCENNDKLATDRYLGTDVQIGDLIVIHDTGAHGHTMGFNYNGKLRSAEYLRKLDGQMVQIRRAETHEDLFATLKLDKDT